MRGSSLENHGVLEAIRPFLVVSWSARRDDPRGAEIQEMYESSEFAKMPGHGTNTFVFAIDPKGHLVHEFCTFPRGLTNPEGTGPKEMARHFRREVERALEKMELPDPQCRREEGGELNLPTVDGMGFRIYVRTGGPDGGRGAPVVVEAVKDDATWDALAYPETERSVDPKLLSRWLRQIYPPGMNEHLYPWEGFEGTLAIAPVATGSGERLAILRGSVDLSTEESSGHRMTATVEAVLRYAADSSRPGSMRAVVRGSYPREDAFRGEVELPVFATVESLPE